MEIGAPLFKLGLFGEDASLAVAAILGVGFGFFLERAGFGSSRKLTAQFYLDDMSVLKVMFTAIVTAMTGVWALSAIGWLDLEKIYLTPTYLIPQAVGGGIFGLGFIIGGYCPGTAVAGIATGRMDAAAYALGMLAGIAAYAESFPALFAGWAESASLGKATLPRLLDVPYGAVVLSVAVMAVAAFAFAERIEKAFSRPA